MGITNLKNHDLGIVTFTRKWHMPTIEAGWGNGYIGFPVSNENCPKLDYNQMPSIEDQSWTYDSTETVQGVEYKVYGFDCGHAFQNIRNWPESRVISTIENFVPIAINMLNNLNKK